MTEHLYERNFAPADVAAGKWWDHLCHCPVARVGSQ
jgi:hypothetical protein